MRKDRNNNFLDEEDNLKVIIYVTGTILAVAVIAFIVTFLVYNNKINKSKENFYSDIGVMNEISLNNSNTSSVSSSDDKTMNEVKNDVSMEKTDSNKTEEKDTNSVKEFKEDESKETDEANNVEETSNESQEAKATNEENVIEFSVPVEGEIIKDFAVDTLVYSETLKEWITHNGIDIAGERTSVVRSAEAGTVEAIKNDPRYGLTVIISHNDGYKTIYSNLLTTEFVSEGDSVDKGQTIATIGDTAAFESSEGPHLHFEILKDGVYQNPTILLK